MAREAPPKPIPGPDPRILARLLERAELEDPEEALTAHLTARDPRPSAMFWNRKRVDRRARARRP